MQIINVEFLRRKQLALREAFGPKQWNIVDYQNFWEKAGAYFMTLHLFLSWKKLLPSNSKWYTRYWAGILWYYFHKSVEILFTIMYIK